MPQAVLFRDSFTGASGPLSAHTPEVGAWESIDAFGNDTNLIQLSGSGDLIVPAGTGCELKTAPFAKTPGAAVEMIVSVKGGRLPQMSLADGPDFGQYATVSMYDDPAGYFVMLTTPTYGSSSTTISNPGTEYDVSLKMDGAGVFLKIGGANVLTAAPPTGFLALSSAFAAVAPYGGVETEEVVVLADPDGTWIPGGGGAPTPPAGSVTGVSSTSYGGISAASVHSVEGSCTTEAGVPETGRNFVPLGVCGTNYGAIESAYDAVVSVDGVSSTGYGTATARAVHMLSGATSTQYGNIIAAYDVSVVVAPGNDGARYGVPLAWKVGTDLPASIHYVYGDSATLAGQPSAASPVSAHASGVSGTQYGQMTAAAGALLQAGLTTGYGMPAATASVRAQGVCGTQVGRPTLFAAHIVKGVLRTKYGRVRAARPESHLVYGLNNGRRSGTPRAVEIA